MKTIFGTTEKSNFILNMKSETLSKFINILLTVSIALPLLGGLAWLITDSAAYVPSITLMVSGFAAILLFIVCLLKQDTVFQKNISYFFAAGIALMAIFCNMTARNVNVSTFGNTGRYEGILALFAYVGIFFLGSVIFDGENIKKLLTLAVIIGLAQSLIGILQMIPALNFPSKFKNLWSVGIDEIFLPSGTAGSPIFLALLLTMLLGIALAGACYEKKLSLRIFYGVSAVIFGGVALCTQSLVAVVGVGVVFLAMGVVVILSAIRSAEKSKLPVLIWLGALIIDAAVLLVLIFAGNFELRDMAIAYQDSYNNLFISGTWSVNMTEFYPYLWGTTVDIIGQYPILGTGMDCLYVPRMHGHEITSIPHAFEKCYNDYLYIAATRGIISLVAYLGLLGISLKKAFGGLKQFFADSAEWFRAAVAVSIAGYAVAIFFGVSGIMVAPYFFLLLGFANANKLKK